MTTTSQAIEKGQGAPRRGVLPSKVLSRLGRFVAWCRHLVRSQVVAEGYEDAEGFHYGKQPHPNCVNLDQYSREVEQRMLFETTRTAVQSTKDGGPVSVSVTRSESSAKGRKK